MSDRLYGYANWETWELASELSNDEGFYEEVKELLKEHRGAGRYEIKCALRDWFEDMRPEAEGWYGQVITNALAIVDWYEVMDSFKEDVE